MHTGEGWRLGHRPALDGLRGVAILLVVGSHTWQPFAVWGTGGVTMFFTLSGFLITTLLLEESSRTGAVRLGAFYRRRAVRLLPAVTVFLAVALALGVASARAVGAALVYASNWMLAFDVTDMGWVSHTWSLSIEEQFYLVWPLVVIALSRTRHPRRWMLAACTVGIGWAWVARPLLWDDGAGHMRVYMGLDTRADALLVGCALAILMSRGRVRRGPQVPLLDAAVLLVPLLALAASGAVADYLLLPMWLPVATAGLIFLTAIDSRTRLLASPVLRWLGRRSYALYLWHGLPAYYLHQVDGLPLLLGDLLAIAVSLMLAELSWWLVEAPAQRWYRSRSVRAVETPGLPGRSGREDPTRPHAEGVSSRV